MAYMSSEHKKEIAELLKKEFGKVAKKRGFKYSLKVENYSTIIMTISEGKYDFIGNYVNNMKPHHCSFDFYKENPPKYLDISDHMLNSFSGEIKDILEKAFKHLNLRNYNNSDIMTDYFDVGHFVYIHIGKWNKPYKLVEG